MARSTAASTPFTHCGPTASQGATSRRREALQPKRGRPVSPTLPVLHAAKQARDHKVSVSITTGRNAAPAGGCSWCCCAQERRSVACPPALTFQHQMCHSCSSGTRQRDRRRVSKQPVRQAWQCKRDGKTAYRPTQRLLMERHPDLHWWVGEAATATAAAAVVGRCGTAAAATHTHTRPTDHVQFPRHLHAGFMFPARCPELT